MSDGKLNESFKMIDFESEFQQISACPVQSSVENELLIQPDKTVAQSSSNESTLPTPSSFETAVLNQLNSLMNVSKEILARYAIIEDSLMKSGHLSSLKLYGSKMNQADEFNSFVQSQKMPFKTVADFKAFEDSLDKVSMNDAVSMKN